MILLITIDGEKLIVTFLFGLFLDFSNDCEQEIMEVKDKLTDPRSLLQILLWNVEAPILHLFFWVFNL